MLTNDREKKTCQKYSKADENGKVHCHECPLIKGNPDQYDFRCKANSSYNRKTKEWEFEGGAVNE